MHLIRIAKGAAVGGLFISVAAMAHEDLSPVGGELDYLDEGTLAAAVRSRKEM